MVTTKTIYGVALSRRCPSATPRLATDGKLCASEIYGVADNVNGTAARFVNTSFNRFNLFVYEAVTCTIPMDVVSYTYLSCWECS
ncbi:hypothetical protein HID58_022443 [Brassica napus]|uniref:Uncharacterized protein n=2 Tax=Brassica TaxID=3705 RepID=A0ABQ8CZ97_BRANA|nr:hypothetical protein HID58_022443 [Brassica napus]CAG7870011.1 unnamed protein product [Brassica rapa]VDC66675.1 unnamed protein product [Brassica rapa]